VIVKSVAEHLKTMPALVKPPSISYWSITAVVRRSQYWLQMIEAVFSAQNVGLSFTWRNYCKRDVPICTMSWKLLCCRRDLPPIDNDDNDGQL